MRWLRRRRIFLLRRRLFARIHLQPEIGGRYRDRFKLGGVKVTIERPPGLVSHELDAIKGHGRYRFLRDMPPSPPPQAD